jgi:hypothetical protein
MFGVLGYGYEYLTGSDLGEDLYSGGQYVYDSTTGVLYDAGSSALESAGQIYDDTTQTIYDAGQGVLNRAQQAFDDFTNLPNTAIETFTEQSGIDELNEYLDSLLDNAERVGKIVRNVAIGAGVAAAGFLAYSLLGKK